MDTQEVVQKVVQYVALVLALCVHEFAHAASALWLGDRTAEGEGRLTLNPLAHADPIGTVLFPLIGFFTAFPLFGWAKPVPVQAANFRRGWFGKGQVFVAGWGPLSNVIQALAWTALLFVAVRLLGANVVEGPGYYFVYFVHASIVINLILAAFNLIPVPPLDGSHIASWGLPRRLGEKYDAVMEPYGFLLLLLLLPVLGFLLRPAVWVGQALFAFAFHGA